MKQSRVEQVNGTRQIRSIRWLVRLANVGKDNSRATPDSIRQACLKILGNLVAKVQPWNKGIPGPTPRFLWESRIPPLQFSLSLSISISLVVLISLPTFYFPKQDLIFLNFLPPLRHNRCTAHFPKWDYECYKLINTCWDFNFLKIELNSFFSNFWN